MTEVEDEKIVGELETRQIPKVEETLNSSDITKVLKSAGHRTVEYPNGLVLGIRLVGIPGTRGVHMDIVHVLDLRRAKFGRSNLAVQAAILESISRPMENLLADIEMDDHLGMKFLLSPLGKMELKVLRSFDESSTSLVHETRTVYAVFSEGSSSRDLLWLTDSSRIVPDSELALLLSSDSRSHLNAVQKSVCSDKWGYLEGGYKRAWFGILPVVMGIFGGLGIVGSFMVGGTLLIPLGVSIISFLLAIWMFRTANSAMNNFQETLNSELQEMACIGDTARIESAINENTTCLEIVGTLNFIITPLMDSATIAMERGDLDDSINSLCSILDECVRFAPLTSSNELRLSGDPGLEKFIGLFKHLGLALQDGEEEALGLSYVALTGHHSSPVKEHELLEHLGNLNNLLFDVGALSPEVKNRIDDLLNRRAGHKMLEEINKELAKPDEFETPSSTENELSDEERALHEEMVKTYPIENDVEKTEQQSDSTAGPESESHLDISPEQSSEGTYPVIVAETVPEEPKELVQTTFGPDESLETGEKVVELAKKKQRSRKELAQIRSSGRKKEREKTEA